MRYSYQQFYYPPLVVFNTMGLDDAKKFFNIFIESIPLRLKILSEYIITSPTYSTWPSNSFDQALLDLGKWFSDHVTTRKRTALEIDALVSKSPILFKTIDVPKYELSNETLSLSADIGMFIGENIRSEPNGIGWILYSGSKKSVDYHQPVLKGRKRMIFNPVRIITTFAYGIADGSQKPERMMDLFYIWKELLSE